MKLISLLILIFLNSYGFSQTDTLNQWTVFNKENFKIQYPKSWRIDTSKKMGTELIIFSPLENKDDKFSENINVLIQDLSGQSIDLAAYKQITEKQLTDMATDSKVFESSILKSKKGDYYKVTYAMTQGMFRLKITSFCFIKGNRAYLVTFTSEFDKYDQYKETGEKILNSFSVVDAKN